MFVSVLFSGVVAQVNKRAKRLWISRSSRGMTMAPRYGYDRHCYAAQYARLFKPFPPFVEYFLVASVFFRVYRQALDASLAPSPQSPWALFQQSFYCSVVCLN